MNIVIPTADFPPIEGGISTVALSLSRELTALGHDVTVIAPKLPGAEETDRIEEAAIIRFAGYGLGWLRLFPMGLTAWPHIRRADLILGINVAYGGILGWLASRRRNVPYVAFAYGYEFLKFTKRGVMARILNAVYARARVIVSISRFTTERLVEFGAPPDRIETIFPGAPRNRIVSADAVQRIRKRMALDRERVILAVGRLIERKGHLTLVRAFAKVQSQFPDTALIIVGQGPQIGAVTREAIRLGVRENVILPGVLPDNEVAALYAACDVFALPTGVGAQGQVEGFGLVFTEAHAYGKPVVAGRSGGVEDAVVDGETGLLVDPDDADAVAGAIAKLLGDPELAARFGENGRRRVESELNWTVFTSRLLDAVERRA